MLRIVEWNFGNLLNSTSFNEFASFDRTRFFRFRRKFPYSTFRLQYKLCTAGLLGVH